MPENWQSELSQFDEAYKGTEPAKSGGGPIPDGTYQAKIESVVLKRAKSQAPMIAWTLKIVGGNREFLDRTIWKNSVIQENTLAFIKKDLELFGIKMMQFSKIQAYLPRLAGRVVELRKVTDGEYSNIYLNQVVSRPAAPAEAAPKEEMAEEKTGEEDESIPF